MSQEVPINVAHPRVQKILHGFLESQERAGSQRLVITDIQSATRQAITETKYRFEFVLGVSQCPRNSTAHRYSCAATGTQPLSNCRVMARHRAGQPLQFNSVSCTSKRQPECANGRCEERQIHPYAPAYLQYPDDPVEVNIHDSAYQQLVQHVQDEVNRRSRRPYLKKFIKTLNATKVTYNLQETAEIIDQELYSLTLRFSDTDCARAGSAESVGCLRDFRVDGSRPTSVCDVRVSSLGWADRMRVLDLFCEGEEPAPQSQQLGA
ncbi:uncharacterized protein LOC119106141 [Pollicipes pollicipes]|uniref:uncharacterized protein LOC119104512 n=1 Tax=Pollicipes pollicipes TaxID=41117 RepID=UPI001885259C|nr:uncharacterized protein LOC119104512 [Pollicipes pollicipes]XP_037085637.1 uncharacterized protein LOC119106141 [Pollicipes pollicipes]